MKPKYILTILALATVITVFYSCKDNPVAPIVQPGRRDYTWTVDTLNIPFTTLFRIWGSSPNDVWAIGPGGDLDKTIFHFDGKKWNNDGISRMISPISIWGFGQNDVWLGGREGRIWHYDGKIWSQSLYVKDSVFVYSGFEDIWGDSPDNVWAIGYLDSANTRKGIIYHYDGHSWDRINIDYKHGTLLRIRRGKKTGSNYFVWGLWEDNFVGDSTKLFEYDGNKHFKELSKSAYGNGEWQFVQVIDDEIILTINNSLYTYKNGKLELYITNNFPNSYQAIFGRSKKDIFWLMQNGITHYNGKDFKYILKFNSVLSLSDGVLFKNYAFFLAKDFVNGKNIIFRGKLK